MKISARNQIRGTITKVVRGATNGHVHLDIGNGVTVHASITNEAIDEMGLAEGQTAYAVVKASDVMIGV